MFCLKCGQDNPPTANLCVKCKAQLPKVTESYEAPRPVITERLQKFIDAVENLKGGVWTRDEFKDFLDTMSKTLAEKSADIRSTEIPAEIAEDFIEEMSIGLEGVSLYEHGMSEMYLLFKDNDINHLDNGLSYIEEGNNKINEAMRINRENRKKLDELYNPDVGPAQ